ncbi:MAG: DEAD/DEAH box helicase family protein [Cellulosilyticaceae bacterium]
MGNSAQEKIAVLKKTSKVIDDCIHMENAITGEANPLYVRLKESMKRAVSIDIIVSFLMESGAKLILRDLKETIARGAKIRILTGSYLNITQPQALYLLKDCFDNQIDLRFYNIPNKSFHPKSYIFHGETESELYVGSSNISRGALTTSLEWNYRLRKTGNETDFDYFVNTFENLWENNSIEITDAVLKSYSMHWKKPSVLVEIEENENPEVIGLFEPRGAQIEALYALKQLREQAVDKALVVVATGIGKTYLAAFDSKEYEKILFIAHREEILQQADRSFQNVRGTKCSGYFYGAQKDTNQDVTFALVQTLGKEEYLCEDYFKPDEFDYIIVDEFHHAVSSNYKRIIDYFKPQFLLGLTATPERLDNKDVFALCDYNCAYEVRLQEAINKGWLVPFRYYGIYDDTVDYSQIATSNGKYVTKELEQSLMLNKRADIILKYYKKYSSKCALGFCTSKAHAEYMAAYFNENGVVASAVYSGDQGMYSEDRKIALQRLKEGIVQIIFSVDMFNEGLDVPAVDMVLFLRPTESPTIFLQQLGRGLRKYKGKQHLIVLDFIGNYKKANHIPFLLAGKPYDKKAILSGSPLAFSYPEGCIVDVAVELIDLFKLQAQGEQTLKEKIKADYDRVKETLGHVPSRVELLLGMDEAIYQGMRSNRKLNVFKDYLGFLKENDQLTLDEVALYESIGENFINRVALTSMSRTYKMPILLAFYNEGNIKLVIDEDAIYKSFKTFYNKGSNGIDLSQDKSNKDYRKWNQEAWVNLAKRNPVKFLLQSEGDFFCVPDEGILALPSEMSKVKDLPVFKKHFKDAIDFRVLTYYKDRFNEKELAIENERK